MTIVRVRIPTARESSANFILTSASRMDLFVAIVSSCGASGKARIDAKSCYGAGFEGDFRIRPLRPSFLDEVCQISPTSVTGFRVFLPRPTKAKDLPSPVYSISTAMARVSDRGQLRGLRLLAKRREETGSNYPTSTSPARVSERGPTSRRIDYNTVRTHGALGYRPPGPEAGILKLQFCEWYYRQTQVSTCGYLVFEQWQNIMIER